VSTGRDHHATKSNRLTVVVAQEEHAAHARSYTAARWVWLTGALLAAVVIGSVVYALFAFTPLAEYVPLPNPALENKYNRELVALNRQVLSLMEEMVRIRSYNFRLRNALGEHLSPAESLNAVLPVPALQTQEREAVRGAEEQSPLSPAAVSLRELSQPMVTAVRGVSEVATFPALFPTGGYVTRGFEPGKNHFGLDIAGKRGALVLAAADGAVVFSGWTPDDGYLVIVSHPGGFVTFYKHNQSLLRPASAKVHRGDPIATLGDSGRTSTGPHVHFEIWKDGTPVDPASYLLNLSM